MCQQVESLQWLTEIFFIIPNSDTDSGDRSRPKHIKFQLKFDTAVCPRVLWWVNMDPEPLSKLDVLYIPAVRAMA